MAATPENGPNDAAGAVPARSTFLDKLKYALGMRPESVAEVRPSKGAQKKKKKKKYEIAKVLDVSQLKRNRLL
jgi:hypothetical protein